MFYTIGSGEANEELVEASGDDPSQTVDDELDSDTGSGSSSEQFGKF